MSTLTDARKAIAAKIKATVPREANVFHYDAEGEPAGGYPRIYVEIPTIAYYATIGVCSKATIQGRIVVEVVMDTAEDVSNTLDDYLDPYSDQSIVAALYSGAKAQPPFSGTVESFVPRDSQRLGPGLAEIPFEFTTTRPAVS